MTRSRSWFFAAVVVVAAVAVVGSLVAPTGRVARAARGGLAPVVASSGVCPSVAGGPAGLSTDMVVAHVTPGPVPHVTYLLEQTRFLTWMLNSLVIGVGVLIAYEGRKTRSAAKRRRQRLRSGRTPQPQSVAGDGRRGPPPPPRKRRAQTLPTERPYRGVPGFPLSRE